MIFAQSRRRSILSIEFKLGRDPQLLQQYYTLRERCFREELGLAHFDGSEEDQDRESLILLAVENNRCVGGARISPTIPLQSQINHLQLNSDNCCMWERLAFDPAVRSLLLLRNFCARLVEVSAQMGYHHAMVLSSLRNARFYRQCHSALGIAFKIHRPVPHSAKGMFAGLEHYMSVATLQSDLSASVVPRQSAR